MTEIEGRIDNFYWTSRTLLQQDHDPNGEHVGWDAWYRLVIESSDKTAATISEVERAIEKEARRLAEMTPLFDVEKERWIR
jgi:hypothetical protein